jgi:hypothetical protein
MDKIDNILESLSAEEEELLLRKLLRTNVMTIFAVRKALCEGLTCELEEALVNFFTWCNIVQWSVEEEADNCGTWLFLTIQAAMGRDEFLRPFLEEAGRRRYLRDKHEENFTEKVSKSGLRYRQQTASMPRHRAEYPPLKRAKDWREYWQFMRKQELQLYEGEAIPLVEDL